MLKFTYIDAADAPGPFQELTPAEETREIILGMAVGKSLHIWPNPDETVSGLKSSFSRVAKREGILLSIEESDSGRAIRVTRLR